MRKLTTHYMGIEMKNPIIVGACNLSTSLENLKKIEAAGAGAIVYKSLFEEQIQLERFQFEEELSDYNERYAEVSRLFPDLRHAGPKEFLLKLKRAKEMLNIPLIGSLNCVNKETWIEYAKLMEETGVDGLELNFYATPGEFNTTAEQIEDEQVDIFKTVREAVGIPISAKISPYYTNTLNFISRLDDEGVEGFVLFNQLFQPDINIDDLEHQFSYNFSNIGDNRLPLRYTGLISGNIGGDICSGSGIYSGKDVIKMLLAGADTVQLVSSLYQNGFEVIGQIVKEIEEWMDSKRYKVIDEFRGKLAKVNLTDPFAYRRAQYVDIILNSDHVLNKYPVI